MNWLHWWVPEFLISALLWLWMAPAVGRSFLKICRSKSENLDIVCGFLILSVVASFLVFLHKWGLLMLIGGSMVCVYYSKESLQLKLNRYDALVFLPLVACSIFYPTSYDTNLRLLQHSFFHSFWPLEMSSRLDVSMAVSVLLNYWFNKVPLFNSLSVQGPFYGLLIWRCLWGSWETLRKKSVMQELVLLVITFMGTLLYRKQIQVKASPVGGAYAFLVCFMIAFDSPVTAPVTGLLMAGSLYFGEYGAILLSFLGLLILFTGGISRKNFVAALPWAFLFSAPEVGRKIFIATGGFWTGALLGVVLSVGLFYFILKKSQIFLRVPTSKNFPPVFFIATVLLAFFTQIYFKLTGPESHTVSLWQWTLGTSGFLFLVSIFYFIKFRDLEISRVFLIFSGLQFLLFSIWHGGGPFFLFQSINPTQVWWNLMKNATMISWPLITTVFGVLGILLFLEKFDKKNVGVFLFFVFFIFLQDPLVRNVGDGPFAPHGPRLSLLQNLKEWHWLIFRKTHQSSLSGNVVLAERAIQVPRTVEFVFESQKRNTRNLSVCLKDISHLGNYDFDTEAYTFQYMTGALSLLTPQRECDFNLIPISGSCVAPQVELIQEGSFKLCGKSY